MRSIAVAYLTSIITAGFLFFQAFAAIDIEKSYPLKINDQETVVVQKILFENKIPLRYFHIPSQDENKNQTPIIFLPDLARGTAITEAMQDYLSNFLDYIAPHVGKRDIYIFPGRTLEGGYLHNCNLELTNWSKEFSNWQGTAIGIKNCLRQLNGFNFQLSDFSKQEMASDLKLLIKDEKLKQPVIWALTDSSMIAQELAQTDPKLIGGLILDHPDLSYMPQAGDAFSQFLTTIDTLAQQRDWSAPTPPSTYLLEAIQTHNQGGIYKGDMSDIAFIEDVNRILPVNSDVLNYYMLAKADQPNFLTQLSLDKDKAILYDQFPGFSIEYYGNLVGLPERYRKCEQLGGFKQSLDQAYELLKDTFSRDYTRQQVICNTLGVQETQSDPIKQGAIKVPTTVIIGKLDPYFSETALAEYQKQFKNLGIIRLMDGSIGTPQCLGAFMTSLSEDLTVFYDDQKLLNEERVCNWSFKTETQN